MGFGPPDASAGIAGLDPPAHQKQNTAKRMVMWAKPAYDVRRDCNTLRQGGGPSREEETMKLYMHPISTTSRPVRLFVAEHRIPVEEEMVDIMTGAQYNPPYSVINPN